MCAGRGSNSPTRALAVRVATVSGEKEDGGNRLSRPRVHLGEDNGDSCRAAEDQNTRLDNTERVGERSRQHEGGEDAINEWQSHYRREEAGVATDPPLKFEEGRVS